MSNVMVPFTCEGCGLYLQFSNPWVVAFSDGAACYIPCPVCDVGMHEVGKKEVRHVRGSAAPPSARGGFAPEHTINQIDTGE